METVADKFLNVISSVGCSLNVETLAIDKEEFGEETIKFGATLFLAILGLKTKVHLYINDGDVIQDISSIISSHLQPKSTSIFAENVSVYVEIATLPIFEAPAINSLLRVVEYAVRVSNTFINGIGFNDR